MWNPDMVVCEIQLLLRRHPILRALSGHIASKKSIRSNALSSPHRSSVRQAARLLPLSADIQEARLPSTMTFPGGTQSTASPCSRPTIRRNDPVSATVSLQRSNGAVSSAVDDCYEEHATISRALFFRRCSLEGYINRATARSTTGYLRTAPVALALSQHAQQ